MIITDIFRSKVFGVQLTLQLVSQRDLPEEIAPGDRHWPRFRAMGQFLKRERQFTGTLQRVQIKQFAGGLTEVQFSFK